MADARLEVSLSALTGPLPSGQMDPGCWCHSRHEDPERWPSGRWDKVHGGPVPCDQRRGHRGRGTLYRKESPLPLPPTSCQPEHAMSHLRRQVVWQPTPDPQRGPGETLGRCRSETGARGGRGGRPLRRSGPCLRRAGGSTSPPAMCGCLGVALHAGSPVATRQRLSEGDLLLDSAHAATARGRTCRPQHPPYTPSRWVPDAASRAPLGCWAQARGTARWGLCHPAIPTVPCTTMAATMPSEVAVVPEPPLWAPVLGRPA